MSHYQRAIDHLEVQIGVIDQKTKEVVAKVGHFSIAEDELAKIIKLPEEGMVGEHFKVKGDEYMIHGLANDRFIEANDKEDMQLSVTRQGNVTVVGLNNYGNIESFYHTFDRLVGHVAEIDGHVTREIDEEQGQLSGQERSTADVGFNVLQ